MRRMLPVGMEVCYVKGDVESEWRRDRAGWFGLPFWEFSTRYRENSASPECLLYIVEELARRHRESHPLLATPQIFRVTTFSFGDCKG